MTNRQPTMLRVQCVNCKINISTIRRHPVLELDIRLASLICDWIAPVIATEDDNICNECWQLAVQNVNNMLSNDPGRGSRGHTRVCITCGISLRSRQADVIIRENPNHLQKLIYIAVANSIAPRQVSSSDCVCHRCWLRFKRLVLRPVQLDKQNIDESEQNHDESEQDHHEPELDPIKAEPHELELESIKTEPHEPDPLLHLPQPHEPVPVPHPPEHSDSDTESVDDQVSAEPGMLNLFNYRRAANTASHCIFHTCPNRDLHRISDPLRATTLSNHNYYIPKHARVCCEHLRSSNWNMLYDSGNSLRSFTAEQVEHVFSFINAFNTVLDFSSTESVDLIDEHLFLYWIGMSKQDFNTILSEVPGILETHRGVLGLGALLMKMRTGDSDDRISQLLRVPRRTLERIMNNIREILVSTRFCAET